MDEIIIPSKGRSDSTNTRRLVEKLDEFNLPYYLLVEESEKESYLKLTKKVKIVPKEISGKGYNKVYQYIILNNNRFFILDDDIFVLLKRFEWNEEKRYWKMRNEDNWEIVFKEFEKYPQYVQTSLAVKQIGWLFKEDFKLNIRNYAFVHFNFDIIKKDTEKFKIFKKCVEDFDADQYTLYMDSFVQAELQSLGYPSCSINTYNFGAPVCSTEKGGCEIEYKKDTMQEKCSRFLVNFFKGFADLVEKDLKDVNRIEAKINYDLLYRMRNVKSLKGFI